MVRYASRWSFDGEMGIASIQYNFILCTVQISLDLVTLLQILRLPDERRRVPV